MDEAIARANIKHFRELLASQEADEAKRKVVLQLLAEEELKLAALRRKQKKA